MAHVKHPRGICTSWRSPAAPLASRCPRVPFDNYLIGFKAISSHKKSLQPARWSADRLQSPSLRRGKGRDEGEALLSKVRTFPSLSASPVTLPTAMAASGDTAPPRLRADFGCSVQCPKTQPQSCPQWQLRFLKAFLGSEQSEQSFVVAPRCSGSVGVPLPLPSLLSPLFAAFWGSQGQGGATNVPLVPFTSFG